MSEHVKVSLPASTVVSVVTSPSNDVQLKLSKPLQEALILCAAEFVQLVTSASNEALGVSSTTNKSKRTRISKEVILQSAKSLGFQQYVSQIEHQRGGLAPKRKATKTSKSQKKGKFDTKLLAEEQERLFAEAAAKASIQHTLGL